MSRIWENPSFYFGEDNFKEYMTAKVAPWISRFCMEGDLKTSGVAKIHYHYFIHPHPRGTIVISHGFCEGFFKYHEVMYYFYQAGYSVFIPEMRGHAYSSREVDNLSMIHVDSFDQYVEDFHDFLDSVVLPNTNHRDLTLFCHSMGGCVGSLFLEHYPKYFTRAVLSSPMLSMRWNDTKPFLISLILLWGHLPMNRRRYMPAQHDFSKENPYPKCSAQSRARYNYQFGLRLAHLEYRTSGGDYAWGIAAAKAMKQAVCHANDIHIPVLMLTAGDDELVNRKGQDAFMQNNPTVRHIDYPKARHELFNAYDEDRMDYYQEIFRFLEEKI